MRGSAKALVLLSLTASTRVWTKIALNPTGYRKVFGENRRCTLEQFPYALWFKVENDVIVVGCLHAKRDPKLAKERRSGVIPLPEP